MQVKVENLEKESRAGGRGWPAEGTVPDSSGGCREQGLVLLGRQVTGLTGPAGAEDLAAGELTGKR